MLMQVNSEVEELIAKGFWKRHGSNNVIEISDMVDEYLQATIAMIKRGTDAKGYRVEYDRDLWLPVLEAEAVKRGLVPAEDGWDA